MSRKSLYNSKVIVKRLNTSAVDAVGGINSIKTTVTTISGRLRQLSAAEVSVGGKDGVVSTNRLYCSKCDIRPQDEIIVNSKVYDVNTINTTSNNSGSLEIDCTLRS